MLTIASLTRSKAESAECGASGRVEAAREPAAPCPGATESSDAPAEGPGRPADLVVKTEEPVSEEAGEIHSLLGRESGARIKQM